MYYLETNSIRILNKKLITPFYRRNCCTSVLTLCELLAGINNEDSFNQRKGILRWVYFSKIPADLDLPTTKMYKAFGISIPNITNDGIILLGALCIACRSYMEFQDEITKKGLKKYWEFLLVYDNPDCKFKESYAKRQNTFGYTDPNMISDFENRWENLNAIPELKETILYDLIVYYAQQLLEGSVIKTQDLSLKDLLCNYDHSLDVYFLCTAYFTGTKLIFKNAPGRNDFIDLWHLMYINTTDIFVTNDKKLLQLMKRIFPDNIISAGDFEKYKT